MINSEKLDLSKKNQPETLEIASSDKNEPVNIIKIISPEKFFVEKPKSLDEKKTIADVLKIFSPGTAIRMALNDILHAEMGALIVFEKEGLSDIIDGGFKINCKFSPQKLVELAKMDGAIIISKDLKKII